MTAEEEEDKSVTVQQRRKGLNWKVVVDVTWGWIEWARDPGCVQDMNDAYHYLQLVRKEKQHG